MDFFWAFFAHIFEPIFAHFLHTFCTPPDTPPEQGGKTGLNFSRKPYEICEMGGSVRGGCFRGVFGPVFGHFSDTFLHQKNTPFFDTKFCCFYKNYFIFIFLMASVFRFFGKKCVKNKNFLCFFDKKMHFFSHFFTHFLPLCAQHVQKNDVFL